MIFLATFLQSCNITPVQKQSIAGIRKIGAVPRSQRKIEEGEVQ
jgi:hypothetical protein